MLSRKLAFLGGKPSCLTSGSRAVPGKREAIRIGMMVGKVQPVRTFDQAIQKEFCARSSGAAGRQK